MATIASLLIHLGVDTKDVRRGTDPIPSQVESKGEQAGSGFTRGFRRGVVGFGKAVAATVASVGLAAGGVAGAAATIGIKTAASMEQAHIGFSTMLGDGQKAQTFLGDLSSFAAKTPFEFPGVRDSARQLLGVGQAAKSVIPTLTAFGDASGALGLSQDQFQRVMLATTQAIGKGKFQAEELLQMTEAGLPVWPLLSKALHKPVPELQKLASQGKLLTKDVLPKLEAQMAKDYGGSMAKQSQTLTGLWSTLTDTVNMGLGKAILPLTPVFNRVLTAVTGLADKGLGRLTSFIETRGVPAIDAFVTKVEGMFAGGGGEVMATAKSIGDSLRGMFGGVDGGAAKADLASIGDSLRQLQPVVSQLLGALPSFNDLVNVASVVLGFLAEHADTLAKMMPLLVAAIVAYKVAQAAANLASMFALPLRTAELVVNSRLAKTNRALTASVQAQTVANRTATVSEIASTAATNAGDLAKKRSIVSTIGMRAASVAAAVGTGIWTAAQWLLNAALSPVGLIVIAIVIAIAALVAGILWLWRNNEGFRNFVLAAWGMIKTAVKAVVDWVLNTAWPMIRSFYELQMKIAKAAVDFVITWLGRLVSFVGSLPGKITSAARGMWDGFLAGAKGALNWLIDKWNAVDLGINVRVPDWVPGLGGKGFSVPDIFPDIPRLAAGGTATRAGSVVVGDGGGPEVMHLPRGASVEPLPLHGGAGGGSRRVVLSAALARKLGPLADFVRDIAQEVVDELGDDLAGGVRA